MRRPVYLAVFLLATLGSLIFGFIPGSGGVASAVCTIIATVTGFKAGVKYQKGDHPMIAAIYALSSMPAFGRPLACGSCSSRGGD